MNVDLHWLVIKQMEADGLDHGEQVSAYGPMMRASEDPANMMRVWGVVAEFWESLDRWIDGRIKWRIDLFVDRMLAGKTDMNF